MRRITIYVLVLFCFFCLFSCGKENEITSDPVVLTNVYTATPLSAPEMLAEVSSYQPFVQGDSLYLYDSFQETYLYRFSLDGVYAETIPIPSLQKENLSLRQVLFLDNGNYLGYAQSLTEKLYSLVVCTSDGTILYRAEPPDADGLSVMGTVDDTVFFISNTTITTYDLSLSETGSQLLAFIPDAFRTIVNEKGKIEAYLSDATGALYRLDVSALQATPLYVPETWDNLTDAAPGVGYDWYIMDAEGIFGVSGKSEEKTLLCSFANSFLTYSAIQEWYVLAPDAFLIRYQDKNNARYLLLTPSDETVERVPLRMAWLSYNGDQLDTMRSIVNAYNTSGTGYSIEIVDYSTYGFFGMEPDGLEQFRKDLLSGAAYDLYAMNTNSCGALFGSMENNGSLADLTTIYTDNVLPSVRKAFGTEKGIFGMPYGITYAFLAAPETRGGTIAEIQAETAFCQSTENTWLYNYDISDEMLAVYASSILHAAGASFDSPAFASFLECVKNAQAVSGGDLGIAYAVSFNGYHNMKITNAKLWDAVREDRVRYTHYALCGSGMTGFYKLFYEEPCHLLGYPTANGKNAIYGSTDMILCAGASGNPVGTMSFLDFYLSDTVQAGANFSAAQFPITESALQKTTEATYYRYLSRKPHTDVFAVASFTTSQVRENDTTSNPDYRDVHLTDAEIEAFRDLIRTAVLSTGRDDMITQIISEELEPFFAGDRSAEDTAEIIQKRASIYLAE